MYIFIYIFIIIILYLIYYFIYIYVHICIYLYQALAYEKQAPARIARLVAKFRGYKRVKSRTPPTK